MTQHPRATVADIRKGFPKSNPFMLRKSIESTLPLVHRAAATSKPLGWAAAADWRQTLDPMHRYGGLRQVRPVGDYYTDTFIPGT